MELRHQIIIVRVKLGWNAYPRCVLSLFYLYNQTRTQRMPLVAPPADEEVGTTTTTARESGKTSAFLSNDNLCGRTLLELVGRGHSILADIKILSERVPPAILVDSQSVSQEHSADGCSMLN